MELIFIGVCLFSLLSVVVLAIIVREQIKLVELHRNNLEDVCKVVNEMTKVLLNYQTSIKSLEEKHKEYKSFHTAMNEFVIYTTRFIDQVSGVENPYNKKKNKKNDLN